MIHADTEGLLDKCHCGAVAGFEESHNEVMEVRARCTECCEQTYWLPTKDWASINWNLARRAEKERLRNETQRFQLSDPQSQRH